MRRGGVPKTQKGKELIDNEAFVRLFFQGADVSPSFMKSQLWCLLVGHAGVLRSEIGETEFALAISGQEAIRGCLQEVLRVRSLVFNTGTFFSDVVGQVQGTETSPVVIFDGRCSVLTLPASIERSDWIVILDRTEPDFPTATDVVNQLFVNRIEDHSIEDALGDLPDSPAAVEILRRGNTGDDYDVPGRGGSGVRMWRFLLPDPPLCQTRWCQRNCFRSEGVAARSGEHAEDEYWKGFLRRIRRCLFELCAVPFPLNYPSSTGPEFLLLAP